MKKAGKIILYTFLTVISLIIILVIVAALAENKIARIAVDQVSKTTSIPIEVENIDFSLIHDFPFATIRLKNLQVNAPSVNETGTQDTIAYLEQLFISVDAKPLLKSVFNVRKVEISNGSFFYKVDSLGGSNLDFLNDTTQQNGIDTSGNSIFLDIKDFTVTNVKCFYNDQSLKAKADLRIAELNLSGLIKNDKYSGEAEGNITLSNLSYDTTNLYLMNKANFGFKVAYDEGRVTVNQAEIAVDNDVQLTLDGTLNLGNSISTEMNVNAEKIMVGGLLKYLPDRYLSSLGINDLSGTLSTKASISGVISDTIQPAITADVNFSGGKLKYMDYPAISNISFQGKLTNGLQRNSKTSRAEIHSLSFQTPKSKFLLSGNLNNIDRPDYQLKSDLELDLDEAKAFIPDSLIQSVSGKVKANISTRGIVPDSISDAFISSVLANTKADFELAEVSAALDSSLSVKNLNTKINYLINQVEISNLSVDIPSYEVQIKRMDAAILGNLLTHDSLQFKLKSLSAYAPSYNLEIKNVKAEIAGDATKPESLDIKIDTLIAGTENSQIELAGTIKNPMVPDYSLSGKFNLNLNDIKKYVPDSLVNAISGNIMASFQSTARLNPDSISEQLTNVIFANSSLNVSMDNVNIDSPDSIMSVSDVSGQINYHSDSVFISQLNARYSGLQIGMNSVSLANVYTAAVLNQPQELRIHGNFGVDDLDYALIEKLMMGDTTAVPEPDSEPMNFTYKINGTFKANSLKYGDAVFKNVDTKFLVKQDYYVLDSLRLNAFNGSTVSSIKVEMLPDDEMDVYFKANINKMDVTRVMQSFKDYLEYEDIKAQNVQGILSTKMDGKIVLKNFEPVYESLMLNGDLTIENGALINVKPVMEVEKITGIGLKNMDKLYFSTLNSSIFLFENELYIPRTEIRSTSFDAMFLGMYSFGEDYEYHIRMFLGEVLSSKSKANLKKQAQDGGFTEEDEKDVTKGRSAIYVVSKSENGKEKAGFDNKRDRLNMAAKVKLQKQMVDMRFNPALIKYSTKE